MKVSLNTTRNDVMALSSHVYKNSFSYRKAYLTSWLTLPICLLIAASLPLLIDHEGGNPLSFIALFFAGIWLLFYPFLMRRSQKIAIQRMYPTKDEGGILGEQEIKINPSELIRSNRYGYSAHYWFGIDRIEVGPQHAFIFIGTSASYIIPKRDFLNEAEFELFVENARMYHREAS